MYCHDNVLQWSSHSNDKQVPRGTVVYGRWNKVEAILSGEINMRAGGSEKPVADFFYSTLESGNLPVIEWAYLSRAVARKNLMTEAMSMEDLWPGQSVHGWVVFRGIKSIYNDYKQQKWKTLPRLSASVRLLLATAVLSTKTVWTCYDKPPTKEFR